eukprot:6606514-Prymnesium_polylepis.1
MADCTVMFSVCVYGVTLSRSAELSRIIVIGSCGTPPTSPAVTGRRSQGLADRASSTLATAHCAGRAQSFPCMTSVALICVLGLPGFARKAET